MANNRVATILLAGSQNYSFDVEQGVIAAYIENNEASGGNVLVTGTSSVKLNNASAGSVAVPVEPNTHLNISCSTPFALTITTEAGVTGKMILTI